MKNNIFKCCPYCGSYNISFSEHGIICNNNYCNNKYTFISDSTSGTSVLWNKTLIETITISSLIMREE